MPSLRKRLFAPFVFRQRDFGRSGKNYFFFPKIIFIPAKTISIAKAGPKRGLTSATNRLVASARSPGLRITATSPATANVVTNRRGVPKKYLIHAPMHITAFLYFIFQFSNFLILIIHYLKLKVNRLKTLILQGFF